MSMSDVGEKSNEPSGDANDVDRDAILERRRRFVTAAMAGSRLSRVPKVRVGRRVSATISSE